MIAYCGVKASATRVEDLAMAPPTTDSSRSKNLIKYGNICIDSSRSKYLIKYGTSEPLFAFLPNLFT